MAQKLYLGRASVYLEADPFRGRPESVTEYSADYLVVDKSEDLATNKFLAHLRAKGRHRNWKKDKMQELLAGSDTPLEKRLEILGEHFELID